MEGFVFQRTAWRFWGLLIVAVAALAFCAFAAVPADPIHTIDGRTIRFQFLAGWRLWAMVGFWGLVLTFCLLKLKIARHAIRVGPAGLADPASHRGILRWSDVIDVALDGSDQTSFRVALSLVGGQRVEIDVDGIDDGALAVFTAVHDHWARATSAPPVRADEATPEQ